jgi:hypothetical protein
MRRIKDNPPYALSKHNGEMSMLCHLYIRNGTAYVPTAAKTQAGYYLDIEPVEVVPISDDEGFARAIRRSIDRGHPVVSTPTRATGFPKPVILASAKVRTPAAFEKDASYWQLCKTDHSYVIENWKKGSQTGWVPDLSRIEILPIGTSVDEAIKQLTKSVQSAWAGSL